MTERCDNCLYHQPCPFWNEGLCDNPQSTYYEHYTQDSEHCSKFTEWEPDCGGCQHWDGATCMNAQSASYGRDTDSGCPQREGDDDA